MPRPAVAVVAAAALVLALSACSSSTAGHVSPTTPLPVVKAETTPAPEPSTSSPVNPASINPCSLVTKAEADTVAGTKTLPEVRADYLCTFPTPTSGAVGQLEIYVGDGAKKQLDIDRTVLTHTLVREPGVADEAWSETGDFFFRKGIVWVSLRVTRLDGVPTDPLLKQLAAIVVRRLP